MQYTLSAAAKAAGKSKSTIHLAIKTGRLSASRTDAGTWLVDASELHRVFGLDVQDRTVSDDPERPDERPSTELAVAQAQIALLREMLEDLRARERGAQETVDDLRRRLDQEQEERRALQRQLAPPAAETPVERPPMTPAGAEPPKGLRAVLGRLLGL